VDALSELLARVIQGPLSQNNGAAAGKLSLTNKICAMKKENAFHDWIIDL